ncbi:hypothetical protein GALMADRAFT_142387 [Galerina marginata CBS 339.88]|uniref:Ubiquitin-like domain-containing protein n=1 Tax=Galerina marginata (strain CBS 339.88) TaxID=685588 RepID=A0A067SZY9_GALM3|nr:hypothetical protein GALMADRAFT_142387 [Galerina marginata CBS 339.88]
MALSPKSLNCEYPTPSHPQCLPLLLQKTSSLNLMLNDSAEIPPKAEPLVFVYDNKRICATATSRELFRNITEDDDLSFHTNELKACRGVLAEIPFTFWTEVVEFLDTIIVMKGCPNSGPQIGVTTNRKATDIIPLRIRILGEGREIRLYVPLSNTRKQVEATLANILNKDPADHFLSDGGKRFSLPDLTEADVLDYHQVLSRTAPVIYLHSPRILNVSVTLSLSSHWALSGIHPVVPIQNRTAQRGESFTWNITVYPDGALELQEAGSRMRHLSWDVQKYGAEAVPKSDASSASDLIEISQNDLEDFNLYCTILDNDTAVVLPNNRHLDVYLDRVLAALGVYEKARNTFISAWTRTLPHEFVAFRFLHGDEASRLDIFPFPDHMIRIFVVFQGVKRSDLKNWETALERGKSEDVSWCRDLVGGDCDGASDEELFRVVELGGMEVVPRL